MKLPESFWQAAVDLAKQYGVFRTAQSLRRDYTRLKQRLVGAAPQRKSPSPAFVELVRPLAEVEGCVIEFESAQGSVLLRRMVITKPSTVSAKSSQSRPTSSERRKAPEKPSNNSLLTMF